MNPSEDAVISDLLLALQLRVANEPLLPRLKCFKCEGATEAFIPLIPLLLSPQTVWIKVTFAKGSPAVTIASMIARLPVLCPDLTRITLDDPPRDPLITKAVSEMLLACNRDALQWFRVDSSLTEEARQVVYQLPRLSELWTIIQERTLLPVVTLPNLNAVDIEFDDLDWLQGFRGAAFEKLASATFSFKSDQIGDFLEEFKSVALTSSTSTALLALRVLTPRSWNPNYRSLLSFTQLICLIIEFSCDNGCSSRVDDDIVMDIAREMPMLEILGLGSSPCGAPRGVTIKGLIALARGCCHLSQLRIHFQIDSLAYVASRRVTSPPPDRAAAVRRQDCALTELFAGRIYIPEGGELEVAMALFQIFPHLFNIEYVREGWEKVARYIGLFRHIGTIVRHTGEECPPYL